MNNSILKAAIQQLHPPPEWRVLTEYRVQSRIADALAIRVGQRYLVGYEMKASRQDLMADINNPAKREPVLRAANEFYYVCPEGWDVAKRIPSDCGLIELSEDESPRITVTAPRKSTEECDRDHLDEPLRRLLACEPKKVRHALEVLDGAFKLNDLKRARDASEVERARFFEQQHSADQIASVRGMVQTIAIDFCQRYGDAITTHVPVDSRHGWLLARGYLLWADEPDDARIHRTYTLHVSDSDSLNDNLCQAADPDDCFGPVSFPSVRRFVFDLTTGWLEEVESAICYTRSEADSDIAALKAIQVGFTLGMRREQPQARRPRKTGPKRKHG
jgi:hypothetical protein